MIARDEETKKIQTVISQGMTSNAQNLTNYLSTWDNYREIWEIHKDAFIRRYQRLNPQVSSFDADIARYGISFAFQECFKLLALLFSAKNKNKIISFDNGDIFIW